MILVCPNCSSHYQVGDNAIPTGGRTVRCIKCKHTWHQPALYGAAIASLPRSLVAACPSCETTFQLNENEVPTAGRKVRCSNCRHIWHQYRSQTATDNAKTKLSAIHALLNSAHPQSSASRVLAPVIVPPQSAVSIATEVPVTTHTFEVSAPSAAPDQSHSPQPEFPPYTEVTIEERILLLFARIGSAITRVAPMQWVPRNAIGTKKVWLGLGTAFLFTAFIIGGKRAIDHRQNLSDRWPATASIYNWLGYSVELPGIKLRNVSYHRVATVNFGTILIIDGTLENSSSKTLAVPHAIKVSLTDNNDNSLYHTTVAPPVTALRSGESVAFETSVYDAPAGSMHLEVTLDE